MQLTDLGWNSFFENHFNEYNRQGYVAMRVIRENRGKYLALNDTGTFNCEVSGKFKFEAQNKSSFPAVGDWVVASVIPNETKAIINAVLPRKSSFSRKVAGEKTDEQIVAANIDTIFIVTGLDFNYNLRRIERYLSMSWDSGAIPVILLNKSDLCVETDIRKIEVESVSIGVDVYTISAHTRYGLENIYKYIKTGMTIAFLGSSGVGKSTIINSLLGTDILKVNEVSQLGSRGRHTTTSSEIIMLSDGGMVIDTPGMRELQVWGEEEGFKQVFDDIEKLALECKFRDCKHEKEPNCAVQEAISSGLLEQKRFESYLKLKKEFAYFAERQTSKASVIEKSHWKKISQYAKSLKKNRY